MDEVARYLVFAAVFAYAACPAAPPWEAEAVIDSPVFAPYVFVVVPDAVPVPRVAVRVSKSPV